MRKARLVPVGGGGTSRKKMGGIVRGPPLKTVTRL